MNHDESLKFNLHACSIKYDIGSLMIRNIILYQIHFKMNSSLSHFQHKHSIYYDIILIYRALDILHNTVTKTSIGHSYNGH
jgi:hypothetical protein